MHLGENQTPQNSQTFYKLDTKCCPGKVGENSLAFQDINLTSTKRFFGIPISPWGEIHPLPCLNYIRSTDQVTFRSFSSKTQKVGARISLGDVDDDPGKKYKGQAVGAM